MVRSTGSHTGQGRSNTTRIDECCTLAEKTVEEEADGKRRLREHQAAARLQKWSVNFVAHLSHILQGANSRRHIRNEA